jgi:Ca2+:H+ antiporter
LLGGISHHTQRFNRTAAGMGTTMLLLSAIGLGVPAVFHRLAQSQAARELRLDTEIAVVLFLTYCANLFFTLRTHRQLFGTAGRGRSGRARVERAIVGLQLVAATAAVAVVSELLVDAVSHAAESLRMSQLFVGVIIVALVGNAAEHYSAIVLARRDQMDRGDRHRSGIVHADRPLRRTVLVFLSYAIAPAPMDLLFTTFELVAIDCRC